VSLVTGGLNRNTVTRGLAGFIFVAKTLTSRHQVQFWRNHNGPRLVLAPTRTVQSFGFAPSEGWEPVSTPILTNTNDNDALMAAVAGAWTQHADSDIDILALAIHNALDQEGYRRPNGALLSASQ